jgi:hypothetical protein
LIKWTGASTKIEAGTKIDKSGQTDTTDITDTTFTLFEPEQQQIQI